MVERPEDYPYSSYASHVFSDKKDIVFRDLIWDMTPIDRSKVPTLYRAFVEEAMNQQAESPLKKVYGIMILGDKTFVRQTLQNVREEHLTRKETSFRKTLTSPHGLREVVDLLKATFHRSQEEVVSKGH